MDVHVVERIPDLLPHRFDLILLFDAIERLTDPYSLFYDLYGIGAIGPSTLVAIRFRNGEYVNDRAYWTESTCNEHLTTAVLYTPDALKMILHRLRFSSIEFRFLALDGAEIHDGSDSYCGSHVLAIASGSDFGEFMRERYVPGTWSKISEYEHVPRYAVARTLALGKRVLDLGCGTGYGVATLAETAEHVVGLDIDRGAIEWAISVNANRNVEFICSNDLGGSFAPGSFDLVTCFEMIEHVDDATQQATVASIARLLSHDGVALISTPNPEITKLYGENPYHIRELTSAEFMQLLGSCFRFLTILEQHIDAAIVFSEEGGVQGGARWLSLRTNSIRAQPAAYVAICSHRPIEAVQPFVCIDERANLIRDRLSFEGSLNSVRFEAYRLEEQLRSSRAACHDTERRLAEAQGHLAETQSSVEQLAEETRRLHEIVEAREEAIRVRLEEVARLHQELARAHLERQVESDRLHSLLSEKDRGLESQALEIHRIYEAYSSKVQALDDLERALEQSDSEVERLGELLRRNQELREATRTLLVRTESELRALRQSKWFRLRDALTQDRFSLRNAARIAYLVVAIATPYSLRKRVAPIATRLSRQFRAYAYEGEGASDETAGYRVRAVVSPGIERARVVHVIANFMLGGSSRLVVDIIEGLSQRYEHFVVTSLIPSPPAYLGINIVELRQPKSAEQFREYFRRIRPAIVHVHYWGDCDEPWYAKAIASAEQLGVPIIENINTPVKPFRSPAVVRYVYVSDYVRRVFGEENADHTTIYPGSDFSHFDRLDSDVIPDDCVGMVYRLEFDKLDERSIEPFIQLVLMRPQTQIIVVGGGALRPVFENAAESSGVAGNFEFTGYVSYQSLPDIYRRMSLFVAPVWKESFGQVGPFAMNMRIPVIGYDVGGVREIVGESELMAAPGDSVGLARIAARLLDSRELRMEIGVRQRARAKAIFSLEAMTAAYSALYDNLVHAHCAAGE